VALNTGRQPPHPATLYESTRLMVKKAKDDDSEFRAAPSKAERKAALRAEQATSER